ncbi:EAL domain-containing protein [Sphingomonas oligophenolica]|uniref:EAL domain-containing protein n=2 Tax=Sphingomonas oligophenolica TaxID=301154 RepID=A0ABU9Y0I2_9SPHN
MSKISVVDLLSRTVLIVDDNPVNLAVVVDHLEDHGFEVTVAQGGEEALKRAAFGQPDLILLDVMMPGIDGFETCRRLKADPATRDIPVIFMTALSDIDDKVAGFEAGGIDYVSKPFQIEELLARVRTHLALRAAQLRVVAQNQELREEIVARRGAETALRFSELRYRRLFETATDGILLLDSETGQVTDANPAITAMLGHGHAALIGHRLPELAPFRKVSTCKALVAEIKLLEHIRYDDWVIERGDGSSIEVEMIGTLYQAGGKGIIQCNIRDITDRREAEARIRYMALHDALTGLPNRIMLADRLAMAIAQARRCGKQVAVLMLDLDHFKHINDSLGHHVGDQLLEAVAVRLRQCLRETDTAARVGGDEFVITLSDVTGGEDASVVARKIQAALVEPFPIDQHRLHIGGSIGVSLFPADGEDAGALLRAADTAMYDAKENGRGGHRFFTPALNEAAQRRHILVNDVHQACARGEFTLHYQPQLALASGQITAVEALIRWNHPVHGQISPTLFVPLLEELGLMVDVGEWVLMSACRQNAAWQAKGLPPVRMAVNLSAQQFYRGDIVETIRRALDEAGLEAKWLELELTESLTLDDTETTIQTMRRLKALGVSLSLDDFGTGWSSLAYVRRFPLDRIKIDRSFMRDVITHPNAAAVVQSILHLAQSLDLGCIAEGVETTAQLDYLERQHCEEIQGFLLSEPLPADAVADMLGTRHSLGALRDIMATAPRSVRAVK